MIATTNAAPTFRVASGRLAKAKPYRVYGRVSQVVGLVIESNGPASRTGDLCLIDTGQSEPIAAEVVGFRNDKTLLMPLGDISGVRAGAYVQATDSCLRVPTGPGLLGRILDGLGEPMDGMGPVQTNGAYPVQNAAPNAVTRKMIDTPLVTGVRVLDGMLTLGEGQRVGIFAGSGVGKSTLLGMIARSSSADVNVVALVGERGRELNEFILNDLGAEGLARSVVICATSDQPALVRIKAAFTATAIAESFRDQGLNVMLMMDSVTRFAMAQREVGLAIGEPPSTKGYTPSVFALLPKLMERAGRSDKGSITALYTILVEGDDTNEPIADAARSILDGHVFLSRKLAGAGHYPPVDIRHSLSRLMPVVAKPEHVEAARTVRELIGAYEDVEDLVSIGAYKTGAKPIADKALAKWDLINAYLRQGRDEPTPFDDTVSVLEAIAHEEV